MWSGTWQIFVQHYSSNYKELCTLKLSLAQLRYHPSVASVQDSTVFYFTNNSVTYLITESGSSRDDKLHALVSNIRLLEIDLRIQLVVIHIPGVVMIQQGTDGLSCGI